jgi:hypothetical protein
MKIIFFKAALTDKKRKKLKKESNKEKQAKDQLLNLPTE